MVLEIAPTLVPRDKFGKYVGIVSSVFAIASVLGPILVRSHHDPFHMAMSVSTESSKARSPMQNHTDHGE